MKKYCPMTFCYNILSTAMSLLLYPNIVIKLSKFKHLLKNMPRLKKIEIKKKDLEGAILLFQCRYL